MFTLAQYRCPHLQTLLPPAHDFYTHAPRRVGVNFHIRFFFGKKDKPNLKYQAPTTYFKPRTFTHTRMRRGKAIPPSPSCCKQVTQTPNHIPQPTTSLLPPLSPRQFVVVVQQRLSSLSTDTFPRRMYPQNPKPQPPTPNPTS